MVDVVIPVYNGENFILDAIKSVEIQTLVPNKLVVIDDGSTDKTAELVLNYKSPLKIDYYKKNNGGLSSARNAGITKCTSEFIAFLDTDDMWIPHKLELQIKIFAKSDLKKLGVVYCHYGLVNSKGDNINNRSIVALDHSIRGFVFDKLLESNKITGSGSAVVIRKECFEVLGLFDETLYAYEDWDMWLRIAQLYEFDYADEILVNIRRHANNMQSNKIHMLNSSLIFYCKWAEYLSERSYVASKWADDIYTKSFKTFISDYRFIAALKSTRQTLKILSTESKAILFHETFGSFYLYILKRVFDKVISLLILKKRDSEYSTF